MTALEQWLKGATRGLSEESATQVRREIGDHYESAREDALASGATVQAAESSALRALGDATTANGHYRRVLLTWSEDRLLRSGCVEVTALWTSHHRLPRWSLLALALSALAGAARLYNADWIPLARVALAFGIGGIFWLAAPFLPVYTSSRSRIFRGFKWLMEAGTLWLAFGPGALGMTGLIALRLLQLSWTEWRRATIRRKLSPDHWPKQLYL